MNPFFLSAVLLSIAAVLLLLHAGRAVSGRRALTRGIGQNGGRRGGGLQDFGSRTLGRWRWSIDAEVPVLLDRLGWRKPGRRACYFALQLGLPLLAVAVAGWLWDVRWFGLLFIAGAAFLLPKRMLAAAVARRQRRLAYEVSAMIPLLRMLFDVGMTVEQTLRVAVSEGVAILPELGRELRQVLLRVDAGLDLADELHAMAVLLDVDDLTECVAILEQLIRQGGGAMTSLLSLKTLLDDRRANHLQERVSKLSAKMSAVMVAFLFPALLIILAGPGFIAIFAALKDIGG